MPESLKQKALSSVKWTAFETAARQGVQLVLAMVLARLLTPAEFGVMALAMVFVAASSLLIEGGFGVALVQKPSLSDLETSSVFYLGVATAFAMAVVFALAAPYIAAFFEMPILEPVTRVLSVSFVIGSFGGVHSSLLAKKMQFGKLARISLSASAVSSVVAVVMAWNGWGIWSLVCQSLAAITVSSVVVWFVSDWRPKLVFSLSALRPLFRFGVFIVGANLLETIVGRVYTLLIGKFYSSADLGFYSRADSTLALPNNFTSGIINRVAMPLFSAAAHDADLLRQAFRRAVRVTVYVHAPIMAGVFVASGPLILTFFGHQWAPAIPYLQVLAFAGLCWMLGAVNDGYLKATGRSKAFFNIELFKKILLLAVALATVRFGILAMVIGMSFYQLIAYLLTAWIAGGGVGYGWLQQIADAWKPLVAALLMMPVCAASLVFADMPPPVVLAAQALSGAASYLLLCHFLKCREQDDLFLQIRGVLGKFA